MAVTDRITSIAATYLILPRINNGVKEVLLHLRQGSGYCDGMYSVPAGHLEPNETPTMTMSREAKEEIGIDIKPEDLKLVHFQWRPSPDSVGGRFDLYFEPTKPITQEPKNMEPVKCGGLHWFPISDLPKNTIPIVKQAILSAQDSITYSEHE